MLLLSPASSLSTTNTLTERPALSCVLVLCVCWGEGRQEGTGTTLRAILPPVIHIQPPQNRDLAHKSVFEKATPLLADDDEWQTSDTSHTKTHTYDIKTDRSYGKRDRSYAKFALTPTWSCFSYVICHMSYVICHMCCSCF